MTEREEDIQFREAPSPSIIGFLVMLLDGWRAIVKACVLTVVVLTGPSLVLPRQYTSTLSFIPQFDEAGGGALGSVTALAAQFGLSASSGTEMLSPDFYSGLILSRRILGGLADSKYAVAVDSSGQEVVPAAGETLSEIWQVSKGSAERDREAVIKRLATRAISVRTDDETGVVTVRVSDRSPVVAFGLATNTLVQINTFNNQARQTQGSAERRFSEARLDEAKAELRRAEGRLVAFLNANRTYEAPVLAAERERLTREIGFQQAVVSSLSQAFEQARILEVRNTPRITVIDSPEVPVLPDPRRLVLRGILGLFIGTLLGITWLLFRESLASARRVDPLAASRFERLIRSGGRWITRRRETSPEPEA